MIKVHMTETIFVDNLTQDLSPDVARDVIVNLSGNAASNLRGPLCLDIPSARRLADALFAAAKRLEMLRTEVAK